MPTPREVFTELLTGITERRFDDLFSLYAPDCVVEAPFALPEPQRWEGIEAMRDHFDGGARRGLEMRADNIVIHETADPEVIVAEWDYHVRASATGKVITVANIQVMRVHAGKIAYSRDFHNHAAFATLQ